MPNGRRSVGYILLIAVVATFLFLGAIVMRSPNTHDHIYPTLRPSYDRTPVGLIGPTDLDAITADLAPFKFPERQTVALGATGPAGDAPVAAEPVQVMLNTLEYAIDPSRVELAAGTPVELTVMNEGSQVHGIWIPDFGIKQNIRSGKTKEFTFTPEQVGRVRFECSYNLCGTPEEHAQMTGYFTVV